VPDHTTSNGDNEQREEFEDTSLDSLRLYLWEIKRTKLLTADEERALAHRIAEGDMGARKRMIESNLRLVVKVAKRYVGQGLPLVDLIEEGNVGVIKAVEKFRPEKNCRFSTYATLWIRQSIERALASQTRTVRIPAHVTTDMKRVIRCSRQLSQRLGREPMIEEIADEIGAEPEYVQRLMMAVYKVVSIETPLGDEDDYHLTDVLKEEVPEPAALIEQMELFRLVSTWLELLSPQEKNVVTLRFGLGDEEPMTLETIGHRYGVTRERIRQIESKALKRLRRVMEEKDYLLVEDMRSR